MNKNKRKFTSSNGIDKFLQNKVLPFIRADSSKNALHKVKASFFAIIIGFIVGSIPILIVNGNVALTYLHMFVAPFKTINLNQTITLISVFILLGAGIGISFKTGLFNIGASGQFLLGGTTTVMMGLQLNLSKGLAIPLMIIIAIIIGALASAFAGMLKALFNVHEVVSTILLNWIIFYFVKYLFKLPKFKGKTSGASELITNSNMYLSLRSDHYDIWIILSIVFFVIIITWFIFKYTTFGFQMKTNGLNASAAKYAGINSKAITIISMAFSGGLAGLAGFIFYSSYERQMPDLGNLLPSYGFEAIAITLLAFSNPVGAVLAGIFYGTIKSGIPSASVIGNVPNESINLVLGLIILFSAIAPILIKLEPLKFLKKIYISYSDKQLQKIRKKIQQEIKTNNKKINLQINELKVKKLNDRIKFKKILQKHSKSQWQSNLKIRKEIIEKNLSIYIHKILQNDWSRKILHVSKNKKLSLIKRDSQIKIINAEYKQQFKEFKLNESSDLKVAKKVFIKSQKQKFKLKLMNSIENRKMGWKNV